MKILALRRNPEESRSDPDVDQVSDLNSVCVVVVVIGCDADALSLSHCRCTV